MITIKIDTVDKSSIIEFGSVRKADVINQKTDTLEFDIIYHTGQTFRPEPNSDVEMLDGATKIFAGVIHSVKKIIKSDNRVRYNVRAKDYSYDLDRQLVIEGYDDKTVNYIIEDILTNFTDGTFTDTNVDCALTITKVTFDRITVTDAIQKLADLIGYSWYVDYDKDIHFFERNKNPATFDIADSDGNHIPETLNVTNDLSQIRNRVFIKGGEIEGTSRTEFFDGDGAKLLFRTANKFSSKPVVEVGSVAKTVGVDFLDDEASFDCFWDYNQKYIRFKVGTVPAVGADNVEIVGVPLYNLVVQVDDPVSILQYGVFEFAKIDKTIKSREEAVSYAQAEIEAYQNGIIEGGFDTYESGLRSGMIINVNSTKLDVNEDFLIQSVGFQMITRETFIYKVKLATLRTVGIIDFLIGLLKVGDRLIEEKGEVILEKTVFPMEDVEIEDTAEINTDDYPQEEEPEISDLVTVQALDYAVSFVLGPQLPVGVKRVFIVSGSPLA